MILWSTVILGLLGNAGAAEVVTPEPSVLDDRAYRFCHVAGANAEQAKQWCPLLDDLPPEHCPGLRETCGGAVSSDPVGCAAMGGGGRADSLGGAPEKPRESVDWGCDEFDADGFETLLRWVAALGVAVLVLVVLRLAVRSFGRREVAKPDERPTIAVEDAPDADGVPEVPSGDLLAAARRAMAEARYGDAALFARAAALRSLADGERLRLHRSRTDREYVRALVREAALQAELRAIVRVVEDVRFGGRDLDRSAADAAVAAAARLTGAP